MIRFRCVAAFAKAALLAACSAALVGCAASPAKAGRDGAAAAGTDSAHPAAANLQALAMREVGSPARAAASLPPLPPGVEPQALRRRALDEVDAVKPLDEVLRDHAAAPVPSGATLLPGKPSSDEQRAEALRLYAHGRAAALENRQLQAITDLRKAQELDPDSTEILRELARSYAVVSNQTKAMELYERLAELDPTDSEAVFTVGVSAASRRDFARAIATLGRLRLAGRHFDHDPVADLLADFTLATALREMGYDRAFIEAATDSLRLPEQITGSTDYAARIESVFRQRSDTWRTIGDARCRLGEYSDALVAYTEAAALPAADPASLHPRVVYANLCLGRPRNAQYELLAAVLSHPDAVGERDLHLAAYLRQHSGSVDLLTRAMQDLVQTRPEDSRLVRLLVTLLPPDRAGEILREHVNRRPRDIQAVSQMLEWLAADDVNAAAALAVALTADHPDLAPAYADRLALAAVNPMKAVRALRAGHESAARSRLLIELIRAAGGAGEAWSISVEARQRWPRDAGLMLQQIQLAAAMQDRPLLEKTLASSGGLNDMASVIGVSQAWRATGDLDRAAVMARNAVSIDPGNFDAVVEVARVENAQAASFIADPDRKPLAKPHSDAAIEAAEKAIAIDPAREEPYEVLAMVYRPGGSFADTAKLRQTLQRLREADPSSPLAARLAAQELIDQRRYAQAIDRLLSLYDADPGDAASLGLAVGAWQRADGLDEALNWLEEELERRPDDPSLIEQWVRVQVLQNHSEQAVSRLEAAFKADPDDFATRRLLENLYRASGQMDAAMELGERRLMARPESVRRELELAALYVGAERAEQALERLGWIRDRSDAASGDEMTAAAALASRLRGVDDKRDVLLLDLVKRITDATPRVSMETYRLGLQALARLRRPETEFDAMVKKALEQATDARGGSIQSLASWQALAQGLIDDGAPAAAGRALRIRFDGRPALERRGQALLGRMILVTDAAADAGRSSPDATSSEAADRSIALIERMDESGALPLALDLGEKESVAQGFYESSIQYSMLGADSGAQRMLRETLKRQPDNAMAMNNLGYMLLEHGRRDEETVRLIEHAFMLEPEEPNVIDSIGWLRYLQGRLDDAPAAEGGATAPGALSLIRKAIDLERAQRTDPADPPSPAVLDHLGDAAWRSGQKDEAVKAWGDALKTLEESHFRERMTEQFRLVQSRIWQLVVVDPASLYDREYGGLQKALRTKLDAVEHASEPAVAPLWNR